MASPVFTIALSYCLGILLSEHIHTPVVLLVIYSGVILLLLWFSYFKKSGQLVLICASLAFVGFGLAAPALHNLGYPPAHLKRLLEKGVLDLREPCRVTGVCTKSSIRRAIGEQFEFELERIENRHSVFQASGKIRLALYYPKGEVPPSQALIQAGERLAVLANLRLPQNFNNPGQFDSVAFLGRQDVFLVGTVKSELLITRLGSHQGGLLRNTISRLRSTLLERISAAFPQSSQVQEIARALLLGEKQGLDPAVEQAFQATGIYHVLVVSGQHVAIIALSLFMVFKFLRLPKGVSSLLTVAALCLYCALTEEQPSIVRATLMAGTFLVSLNFDRDRNLLNSLSLAALLILLDDPRWVVDPGFQLSFLSVLAIALIALPALEWSLQPVRSTLQRLHDATLDARVPPRWADFRIRLRGALENLRRYVPSRVHQVIVMGVSLSLRLAFVTAEIAVVSFSIQAVFVILMILYFHRVSSLALVMNLIVVPLVGLIVPIGFLCLLISFISQAACLVLAKLCILMLRSLLTLTLFFSSEAWGNYRLTSPPVWIVVVYFFLLGCILVPRVPKRMRLLAAFSATIFLFAILLYPFAPRLPANNLQITLIDVRQGDSILLSFPGNRTMLIDGGGLLGRAFGEVYSEDEFDVGERVVSPFLWSLGLRRIDRLVLTHAHHDHMAGLRTVINNFPVEELWIGKNPLIPEYVGLLKAALRKGVFIRTYCQGETAQFANGTFEFLNPGPNAEIGPTPKNNDSLAFRLRYGERSFLLTGDIEQKIEDHLIASKVNIKADVLKVGHHGSRTSTSPEFLSRVQPVWALISVAAHSPFGHPHPETIQCLVEHRVPIFRTDEDGAITLTTDGRNLEICLYAEK